MFVRAFLFAFAALTLSLTAHAEPGPGHLQGPGSDAGLARGGMDHGGFNHDHDGGGMRHGGGGDWDHHGGDWDRGGGYGGGWHRGGGVYFPGDNWGHGGWDNCDFGRCDGTYVGGSIACAPKTFEGNVDKTDRVLKTLAASQQFATANQFKSQVSKISAQKDAAVKATAYLKLAGIDSNNSAAVVEFVGARSARGSWINELQRNSNLTSAQAETVASKLQTALRGGLQ